MVLGSRYQFPKSEVFSNEVLYTIAFNFERRFHYTNTYTSLHKYIYIIPQIHIHISLHKYIYIITQIHIHQQNRLSTGSSQVAHMEFDTSGTYIKGFWAQVKRQKLPILRNLTNSG